MSKKREKEQLDRINAAYDAIFNDVSEMPLDEVWQGLADAGLDREHLRVSLHMQATEFARRLRASGQGAPPYLARLIEQSADASTLPADPKRALEKAKQYFTNLLRPLNAPGAPEIVGAFRGEGELSERDQQTIDQIDAELRERAEAEDEEPKT